MKFIIIMALLLAGSGCNIVKDEAGYAGGTVGRAADTYLFVAMAQKQRADRYFLTLSIVAPLSAELSQGAAQADAASTLINDAYANLALMYKAAGACLQKYAADDGCIKLEAEKTTGPSAFSFETHAYDMQRTMLALTKQTLSAAELDDLAKDIIDLDVVGVLRSVRKSVPVARRILASYRDTIVTFADAINNGCYKRNQKKKNCKDLDDLILQIEVGSMAKTTSLATHDDRVIRALLDELKKAQATFPNWTLQSQHIIGLMYHIDRACEVLATRQMLVTTDSPVQANSIANCGPTLQAVGEPISESASRKRFMANAKAASENTTLLK